MVGDPLWDAAVASLADFDHASTYELINACMEQDEKLMSSAPQGLRDFFEVLENPPASVIFDPAKAIPGTRAFHKNSDMFFVGLVLDSVISGFTTGVSKSFYKTGRTTGNLRRLKQNTRHLSHARCCQGHRYYFVVKQLCDSRLAALSGWTFPSLAGEAMRLCTEREMQQGIIQTVDSDAVEEARN